MCRGRAGQANVGLRCTCVLQTLGKRHSHQNSIMLLLLGNAGLFMVDHIHFQYNGFLSGVLLLSISAIASHNFILAGLLFSALLMLKHIYLYMAPAYIVFMLRSYCFKTNSGGTTSWSSFSPVRLILLGLSVLVNVGLAMGPFILSGESLLTIPTLTMFLSRQPPSRHISTVPLQARTVPRLLGPQLLGSLQHPGQGAGGGGEVRGDPHGGCGGVHDGRSGPGHSALSPPQHLAPRHRQPHHPGLAARPGQALDLPQQHQPVHQVPRPLCLDLLPPRLARP